MEGGIIFLGSLATTMGFPENPSYQAAKCGIVGLTQSFAYDLGKYGIRANCVSPGYIKTNMTKKSYNDERLNKERLSHMLIKRWGEPEDVSNLVNNISKISIFNETFENYVKRDKSSFDLILSSIC